MGRAGGSEIVQAELALNERRLENIGTLLRQGAIGH
jgi:hypothetical protein